LLVATPDRGVCKSSKRGPADLISAKLPALQFYQLSIPTPSALARLSEAHDAAPS
jgi:hypothetical protein